MQLVVMRDFFDPTRRHGSTAQHVLEERPDLFRARRAAERDQQHARVERCAHRALASCTKSTNARTWSTLGFAERCRARG